MRGFDWDDLRFFLAVARAGTVSRAARQLGADHATVIRRIDGLERTLGAKLFERTPRGYNLTQRGERLLPSARTIEENALAAERELGGEALAVHGVVRISSLEGFSNFFLAPLLPRFANLHPNLAVELLTIQQIVALSRREADLGVTLQPSDSERFQSDHLTDYLLYVYGSEEYLAGHPPIRSKADLTGHRFVGYIDDLIFTRGLDYLAELGRGLRVGLQSSSLQAQLEATAAGYGLCVLPAFVARGRGGLKAVLPEEVSLRRSYWLVSGADEAMTSAVRAARSFILAEARAAEAVFLETSAFSPREEAD